MYIINSMTRKGASGKKCAWLGIGGGHGVSGARRTNGIEVTDVRLQVEA